MTAGGPLLLDLDRTLVDLETFVDYCAALEALRTRFPHGPIGTTPPTSGWGSCTKEVIARLVGLASTPDYASAAEIVARFELAGAPASQPMPGLAGFMESVRHRPKAIVTLVGPEATDLVLRLHGIEVDVVVPRRPDLKPKPFPDQLEEGLQRLGASAKTATMLGDSATDLQAAQTAGVAFVGVTNGRETSEFRGVPVADDLASAGLLL